MKKLLKLLAAGAVLTAALLPATVTEVSAAEYYPGYTCNYRDIAGSCLNYQAQNPYFFNVPTTYRNPYGNRQTYPFNSMFNAYSVNKSPWDNRYSNNRNQDGQWKWYFDEDDNTYHRYRYQSGNNYEDTYAPFGHHKNGTTYEEYEHTRYFCSGRDCSGSTIRY